MPKYFIEFSYNGKNYHGWQIQKNVDPTVQSVLNKSLSILFNENIETLGSSRTDTGVHAKQNFAHFTTEKEFPDNVLRRLNFILPLDIAAKNIFPVKENAHARFDAISRYYEYYITYDKNPFLHDFACFYPYHKLDMEKLNLIAKYLSAKTDFAVLGKKNSQVKTTLCYLEFAKWEWNDAENLLVFKVKSNRFLRGMVRALVQTSIQVCRGKIQMENLDSIFEMGDNRKTDFSAPANGLHLMQVNYPEGYFNIT